MEYQDEIPCFIRAAVVSITPVLQKEHSYDATRGPFTHPKVNKYLELYIGGGIIGVCPCSGTMELTILPLALTGEKKIFREWMHKVYWACRNPGLDGETAAEVGRLGYILIDILVKRVRMSFHRFLGTVRDSVAVYSSGGGTHLSGRALAAEMEHFLECGYRTVKMKVGTEFGIRLDYDVEWVKLVRTTIGPDVSLAIDGNHVFLLKGARRFADRAEAYNIAWSGESVHAYDFAGYCELARDLPIVVVAGEPMRDHYLFKPYLEAGVKHFQPTPPTFSGVKEWIMVGDMVADSGLDLSSDGPPLSACLLMATAEEDTVEESLEVCNQPVLDCIEVTTENRDGRFHIPDLPGLSSRLDVEWLRRKRFLLSHMFYKAF